MELTLGTQPDPKDRRRIIVNEDDLEKIETLRRRRGSVAVHDEISGETIRVRRVDCGLDCYCALDIVR